MATVLVYSDDPRVRESVRVAVGRTPAADLGPISWLEAATHDAVVAAADNNSFDLAVLDAEAAPMGGLGISRQLKAEIPSCPPLVALVQRKDDQWLGRWSQADAVLQHPADPEQLTAVVVDLLRQRLAAPPVAAPKRGLAKLFSKA